MSAYPRTEAAAARGVVDGAPIRRPGHCWRSRRAVLLLCAPLLLSACASHRGLLTTVGPDYRAPNPPVADGWQASRDALAHGGDTGRLTQWWAGFDDPVLLALLEAAQRENATLAQASARIERARADAAIADAASLPTLDAIAGASRGTLLLLGPPLLRNQYQAGVQSSWEIDLFGGRARQREAALAHLQSSVAAWHDARVAVAAEVANSYLNHRYCEAQVALARSDARSRSESLRLAEIAGRAGFQPPATVALARAVAADGAAVLAQRSAQCELSVKSLVALTGIGEPTLRRQLEGDPAQFARLPSPPLRRIDEVPARVLLQRPDVAAAERELAAASADIGAAEAQRYPGLTLSGSILPTRFEISGTSPIKATTWSIGPSLSLPLFDGGRRRANAEAARAQYKAVEAVFRAKVRTAAREVEESLVRLAAVAQRQPDVAAAADGYRVSFEAAQARHRGGLGSLIEVEEARRTMIVAQSAVTALEQERVAALIALYRAAGGAWDDAPTPPVSLRSSENSGKNTQ
jgi:multidrug efflux system outer membrane protein